MKKLTMDDLATIYDKAVGGRKARTLPMETVLKWAEKQPRFCYDEDDCLCLREESCR